MRRLAVPLALLALAIAPAGAAAFSPGAEGLGDPFFPSQGNGGYDAQHYVLAVDYKPAGTLTGSAIITAKATQALSAFNLDLRDMYTVKRVTVNARLATFAHAGQELTITPPAGIASGKTFVVTVEYAGVPEPVVDPDESFEGWIPTPDGAYVVGEPQGSPGWYPVNDTPKDKATYTIAISLPKGATAVANGRLVSKLTLGRKTTWIWNEDRPMASYLVTATNGQFRFWKTTGPKGIPIYNAVDTAFTPEQQTAADTVLAKQGDIIGFFSSAFGPYRYTSGGAIVDDAGFVGYALESQTKANYSAVPSEGTVAHEIAHQWWGNSVTLDTWPDIWLNEGFATWSQWLWDEHVGGRPTAQQRFDTLYARPETSSIWNPPVAGLTDPVDLFASSTYQKGAMTLQALRVKIGEADFTALLRAWFTQGKAKTVTTPEFIALAEQISGDELSAFFDVWLYQGGKPVSW